MKSRLIIGLLLVVAVCAAASMATAQTPPAGSPPATTTTSAAGPAQGRAVASALATAVERWKCARDRLAAAVSAKASKSDLAALRAEVEKMSVEVASLREELRRKAELGCGRYTTEAGVAACVSQRIKLLEGRQANVTRGLQVVGDTALVDAGVYRKTQVESDTAGDTGTVRETSTMERIPATASSAVTNPALAALAALRQTGRRIEFVDVQGGTPDGDLPGQMTRLTIDPPQSALPSFSIEKTSMTPNEKRVLAYVLAPLAVGGTAFAIAGAAAPAAGESFSIETDAEIIEFRNGNDKFSEEDGAMWGGIFAGATILGVTIADLAGAFDPSEDQRIMDALAGRVTF